jgi:hypothetical protein
LSIRVNARLPYVMKRTNDLYQLLYISAIAPDLPISCVADIARKARIGNNERGITGLLIFDGQRFCEYVEGSEDHLMALKERVRNDHRHIDMKMLHHGPLRKRRFTGFSLGYAEVDDSDVLERLSRLVGQSALDALDALLPTLDLDG